MQKEEQKTRKTVDNQPEHQKDPKSLQPGEKGFTCVLAAVFAFMFYQSVLLWQKKPGIAGPAIIPLIASGLILLLTICMIIANVKKPVADDTSAHGAEHVKNVVRYLVPVNVTVALGAILLYCVCLALGVSFYIITPVFLWGMMTVFQRGNYLRNLIWTAICMVFIIVVFQLLFKVVLP